MFLLFHAAESERGTGQGLISVMDGEVWRLEGPAVQVIPMPLPPWPFNFNFKNGVGTFFGLNNFWSQEVRVPLDCLRFLLIVSTSRKALIFTTAMFSLHLLPST